MPEATIETRFEVWSTEQIGAEHVRERLALCERAAPAVRLAMAYQPKPQAHFVSVRAVRFASARPQCAAQVASIDCVDHTDPEEALAHLNLAARRPTLVAAADAQVRRALAESEPCTPPPASAFAARSAASTASGHAEEVSALIGEGHDPQVWADINWCDVELEANLAICELEKVRAYALAH